MKLGTYNREGIIYTSADGSSRALWIHDRILSTNGVLRFSSLLFRQHCLKPRIDAKHARTCPRSHTCAHRAHALLVKFRLVARITARLCN